jgi:hypothetical protein
MSKKQKLAEEIRPPKYITPDAGRNALHALFSRQKEKGMFFFSVPHKTRAFPQSHQFGYL